MIQGLGKRLQQKRSSLKLSQKEVANAVGVNPSVISNYENGERTPSVEVLVKLASLFQCSVDFLLGIEKSCNLIDVSMLDEEQRIRLQYFLSSINK